MRPSRLRAAAPYALAVLLAIAAHARSLGADLVYDDRAIVANDERLADPARWGELFTSSYWGDFSPDRLYRPVTTLSFALGRVVHGTSPIGPHAVNLALHALVTALLLTTIRRLFPARPGTALGAALLFACHPALSEAVVAAVGRADLLAALFSLVAVNAAWSGTNPLVGAGAAALAFLSKESAIGLAVVLPVAAGLRSGGARFAWRGALSTALSSALLLGGALTLRAAVLTHEPPTPVVPGFAVENPLAKVPPFERILTASHVLGRYALLFPLPIRLRSDASFEEIPLVRTPLDAGAIAGAAFIAGLALVAFVSLRRRSPVSLAALLALLPLAIVSNLAFPIGTIYGERLLYLPSIGLIALAAAAAPLVRRAGRPALVIALVLFSFRTMRREAVFESEETFFRAMVADSPGSAKAWNTLAVHLLESRRFAEADVAIERALRIYPDFPEALAQKGKVALARGDVVRAEAAYREAIARQPAYGLARLELGQILKDGNPPRLDEAALEFELACRLLPRFPEPAYGLGVVRMSQEREGEALVAFEDALRRRPGFAYALYGRGVIRYKRGDFTGAEADFESAVDGVPQPSESIFLWLEAKAPAEPAARRILEALRRRQ